MLWCSWCLSSDFSLEKWQFCSPLKRCRQRTGRTWYHFVVSPQGIWLMSLLRECGSGARIDVGSLSVFGDGEDTAFILVEAHVLQLQLSKIFLQSSVVVHCHHEAVEDDVIGEEMGQRSHLVQLLAKSLVYTRNRHGPRTDPCGTSDLMIL